MRPLIVILLTISSASGIAADTLFYKSSYESAQFKKVKEGKPNYIALFLAIDSDSTDFANAEKKLNSFYGVIQSKGLANRQPKAFAKLLFKEVHNYFFRQYQESALFSQIFINGKYNCVSASALYAIILDHYSVSYAIKELPTHIYLVAFPGTFNIQFEATNPKGLFIPDPRAQEDYVNRLIKAKYTTQEYVSRLGYPKAFQEFYYAKDNINIINLAGIQYSNETIHLVNNKKTEEAMHMAMKAYNLYPSKRNEFAKMGLIGEYLNDSEYDKSIDVVYLVEYANSIKDKTLNKDIVNTFKQVIYNTLVQHSDDSTLTLTYTAISDAIRDSTLQRDIDFSYNLAFTEWHGSKGKFDAALNHARKAYKIMPSGARIQELIAQASLQKLQVSIGKYEDLKILDEYEKEFPFLKANNYFISLHAVNYAFLSSKSFSDDNEQEGYKYLDLLIGEIRVHRKELLIKERELAIPFAEAGAYHFRKKQFIKAKEILNKGFEFAPDDYEIRERIKIVDDEVERIKKKN